VTTPIGNDNVEALEQRFADDLAEAKALGLTEPQEEQFRRSWQMNPLMRERPGGMAELVELSQALHRSHSEPVKAPPPSKGEPDHLGRVPLAARFDPDELLADPLAVAKAWRIVRDEGLPYVGDRSSFEAEWRVFIDLRLDLVETLRAQKAREEEAEAAWRKQEAERPAREAAAKKAEAEAAMKERAKDLEAYEVYRAEERDRARSLGHDFVPYTFDEWRKRRDRKGAAVITRFGG
jgi:hypothetical protein